MLHRGIALLFSLILITSIFADEEEQQEQLFLSTPEQIATLTSESSHLIGGIISPFSGQVILRCTDFVVKGAQDIPLQRIYIPPYIPWSFPRYERQQAEYDKMHLWHHLNKNYKGWQFYPHLRLEFYRENQIRICDPSGMTLDFDCSNGTTSLSSLPYALTNTAGDHPSGKYDPRNTHIAYDPNKTQVVVQTPDGVTRLYRIKQELARCKVFLLEKEILSNGRVLRYHYQGLQLKLIESLDPKERYVYATLRVEENPERYQFISSSGQTASYHYLHRLFKWKFKKRHSKQKFKNSSPPLLMSVSSPSFRNESMNYSDRYHLNSYSGKDHVFRTEDSAFGEEAIHYRAHRLLLPVGDQDAFQCVHELTYQVPIAGQKEGKTTVKNSDQTTTVYHFSKSLLLTCIQHFDEKGCLRKEKHFSWSGNHWLIAIELHDGNKNLLYRKSYEYDRFGNPILETFTGDLTGEGNQESFVITREFSEDGRNLLLKEETEEGKALFFSYLPHTNLITSKLTKDHGHIFLREFFLYDDCHNLIQVISDDGESEDQNDLSNVKKRTFKTYVLRRSAPFLHMPEWIEETYLESGVQKLLKKTHLIYNQWGNVEQEEIYGSDGKYAYTLYKTYNERGDLLTETNCLKQQAIYTYDLRGRPQTATNFSNRITKTFHYDTQGRLREKTEQGDDGVIHHSHSEYDFHGRRILYTDPFSNTTRYTYDLLTNEVIQTDFPPIATVDGQAATVSTFSSYDPLGNPLSHTDANANTTHYRYNAYSSPIEILHPQGKREQFRYEKNGRLASHTDLDGLTTHYKRDILGRVLSKTYIKEDILAEETFTYDSFNLLTETDKEGNVRLFSYDGVGRKILEEFCGKITEFSYDPLGYLIKTFKHNQDQTLLIHFERDNEGKILFESKTDAHGQLLYQIGYSYDQDGNQETIARHINGQEATDQFSYDSFGRLIQHVGPEGHSTITHYDEKCFNPLGQKVLKITKTDPRNILSIQTQDALSRTVKKQTLTPQGSTVSSQKLTYDPHGNLIYQQDHLYEDKQYQNTQTIQYTYTPDHQIASLTQAYGTNRQRTTYYTYFPSGKISTKTLPDGITLTYRYHPLGFLSHLSSSDGKISHVFTYNKLGHLLSALDEHNMLAIHRTVDPFGNVLLETFPNQLKVEKKYDDFNRLLSLNVNNNPIFYDYDPLFLRKVTRFSPHGTYTPLL